jgi:hypothetical protein
MNRYVLCVQMEEYVDKFATRLHDQPLIDQLCVNVIDCVCVCELRDRLASYDAN